jgi:hypothetical protein
MARIQNTRSLLVCSLQLANDVLNNNPVFTQNTDSRLNRASAAAMSSKKQKIS